ncbi:hypothetical protein V8E55_003685 [Tylopilus felleus]
MRFSSKHAVDGFSESLSKELPREWNIQICILQTGGFDSNTIASGKILPIHPAYTDTLTAAIRDSRDETSFYGDPCKFEEMLHRLVEGADEGEKIPLFLPVGEDALDRLQVRLRKQASCWRMWRLGRRI